MANRIYTHAKRDVAEADLDLSSPALELLLVKTGSTAGSELDAEFLADLTTLAEFDGSGYTRKTLQNAAGALDLASGEYRITADPITWSPALGQLVGSEQVVGAVLIQPGASEATRRLVAFLDEGGFPFNTTGGAPSVLTFSSSGALVVA